MNNPEVTVYTVGTTPQLIFTGCGKVDLQFIGPANSPDGLAFGGASVVYGTSSTTWFGLGWSGVNSKSLEFKADAALYAVASANTVSLRVTRYF